MGNNQLKIDAKLKKLQRKNLSRKIILYFILEILLIIMTILQIGRISFKSYIPLIVFIIINGYAIYYYYKKYAALCKNDSTCEDENINGELLEEIEEDGDEVNEYGSERSVL